MCGLFYNIHPFSGADSVCYDRDRQFFLLCISGLRLSLQKSYSGAGRGQNSGESSYTQVKYIKLRWVKLHLSEIHKSQVTVSEV